MFEFDLYKMPKHLAAAITMGFTNSITQIANANTPKKRANPRNGKVQRRGQFA